MLNKDNIYGAYKLFTSQPLKALKYAKNLMVHCSPLSVIRGENHRETPTVSNDVIKQILNLYTIHLNA